MLTAAELELLALTANEAIEWWTQRKLKADQKTATRADLDEALNLMNKTVDETVEARISQREAEQLAAAHNAAADTNPDLKKVPDDGSHLIDTPVSQVEVQHVPQAPQLDVEANGSNPEGTGRAAKTAAKDKGDKGSTESDDKGKGKTDEK